MKYIKWLALNIIIYLIIHQVISLILNLLLNYGINLNNIEISNIINLVPIILYVIISIILVLKIRLTLYIGLIIIFIIIIVHKYFHFLFFRYFEIGVINNILNISAYLLVIKYSKLGLLLKTHYNKLGNT